MSNRLRKRYVGLILGLVFAATASRLVIAYFDQQYISLQAFKFPDFKDFDSLSEGYTLKVVREYDEDVSAIATVGPEDSRLNGFTYVGTSPRGAVYFFSSESTQNNHEALGLGLGEQIRHGTCNVNAIAVKDIDGDGGSEVLVSTSQILPRGKPRLFIYGSGTQSEIRAVARPGIRSSWSHGLGFLPIAEGKGNDIFITFCGFGEIVEYRPSVSSNPDGFSHDTVTWKQVGQLPASGEWLQTADIDNDGVVDICTATGYAERRAALHVYNRRDRNAPLTLRHKIEEDSRFGNVFFHVGDLSGKGQNELIAWWCTEIAGGYCEMIRYRLDENGAVSRELIKSGDALEIMPHDGQTTRHDMNGDGISELWYSTWSGRVWSYDPSRTPKPVQVLKLKSLGGPIASFRHPFDKSRSGVYLGVDRRLVMLQGPESSTSDGVERQTLASRSAR